MKEFYIEIPFLDLEKMYNSGQCFSWVYDDEDDSYLIVDGKERTYIKKDINDWFKFSYSTTDSDYWMNYFDLDTNYDAIHKLALEEVESFKDMFSTSQVDSFDYLKSAIEYGYGIRILKQDVIQTCITFIISQNNNMSRIKRTVLDLITYYGGNHFPNLDRLKKISIRNWKDVGTGYRAEYLKDFSSAVWEYQEYAEESCSWIEDLSILDTENLMNTLMEFVGIGNKVASEICLCGFHRLECVPMDVHMTKICAENFHGRDYLKLFDRHKGLVAQWLFDMKTNNKH